MIKFYALNQAEPGTYSLPLLMGNDELLLCSVEVPGHDRTDTLTIYASVGWEKPELSDIGQLDLVLRSHGLNGGILQQTEASCFFSTTSILHYAAPCHSQQPFGLFLTARSEDARALVTGPVSMEVRVSDSRAV